ncbi:Serine/threonine-protein kinase [Dorcoceras hygrometricum]|uniref:Serine/threonine-protein kinase n=1 Tax=Dorcoceras hygrometricum TaxID=472368 RepID=A0A2Z7A0B9_9LAMI|nr:Serine/threonine-protein kinase [Dorcoceras hygrometricum]
MPASIYCPFPAIFKPVLLKNTNTKCHHSCILCFAPPPSHYHHLDTLANVHTAKNIRDSLSKMGCVQGKGTDTCSPQRGGLDELKLEYGYHAKSPENRESLHATNSVKGVAEAYNATISVGSRGGERNISRESERVIGGNISQRIYNITTADEFFGWWPRWLVENIPKDALDGLVPKTADSYDKLAKVGKGTYSNVYKAREKSTGKIVALKKVRFDTSEPASVKFMAREIIMLKKLDHPNIIKLEGIATSRMQYSLYLVFDFMPSDLTKLVARPEGRFTEPQVKCYMQQLLGGLQHCHERGILHRDIKGSNLLIDKNGVLKIADFGLANFYKNKPKRPLTSRVVTLWYRAPELLLGSTEYGVGIDLWSVGCLLAEMFVGRPIMPGTNEIEQLHKIFKLCGSPSEDYWKKLKPPATFRPQQQYKTRFRETFSYFPESAFSLLERLLALDPTDRGTAASALQNEFFKTSPLPCDLSDLPVNYAEEDGPIQSMDRTWNKNLNKTVQSHGTQAHQKRKVSFSEHIGEYAFNTKEDINMGKNLSQIQEFKGSTSSTSSSTKLSGDHETPPRSPTPSFRSQHARSAKTEAHPNALKNIKNYPLLIASLTEAAHHLEESNSRFYRRSISNIDFRNLDIEKITKLFGLEDQ